MKNLFYYFVAALTVQLSAFSQITLNASDVANLLAPGKSQQEYSDDNADLTMDIGVPSNSQSQTWTVPIFTPSDSTRSDNILPSSTPHAANFAGAAFCQKTAEAVLPGLNGESFLFIGISNDSLYKFGGVLRYFGVYNNQPVDTTVFSYEKEFIAALPIQLGHSKINSVDTMNTGGGLVYITTETETYDAFGTLVLPNGSFQALRARTESRMDMYEGTNLINSYASYTFHWITREGHQLEVDTDTAGSGIAAISSIKITYLITTPPTSAKNSVEQPMVFALKQNYPNPFNPSTEIRYQISEGSHVTLKVFDLLGREVATLVNETKSPGAYKVNFNAKNLSSGVYLYQLRAGATAETKRMAVVK